MQSKTNPFKMIPSLLSLLFILYSPSAAVSQAETGQSSDNSSTIGIASVDGNVLEGELGMVDSVFAGSAADNILDVSWRLQTGSVNVSERCAGDTNAMYANMLNLTLWAFEMWDATAKQPFGYIHGSTYQLGNFDECVKPHARSSLGGISRQYCLADVVVDVISSNARRSEFKENFDPYSNILDKIYYAGDQIRRRRDLIHWAMCVPASCTPNELELMMNRHFQDTSEAGHGIALFRATVNPSTCQLAHKSRDVPVGAIIFFVFFGTLILIVTAASIRHWYLMTMKKGEEARCSPLVQCYSVIHQLKGLGETDDTSTLDVLYGIKVLSICFIITDHRLGTTLAGPLSNMEHLEQVYRSFEFMFLSHGDLIVDSFLVLSGLLAIHGLLRKFNKGPINAPMFIFLRFLRLVPAYAVTLWFAAAVLPLTGSGPLWGKIERDAENCRSYWWTNMLMINNYVHVDDMCMFHSWYIPVDFQLSVVFLCSWAALTAGPGAAKRICSHRLAAPLLAALLLAVSILVPGLITYMLKLPAMLLFHDDFLTDPQAHPIYQIMYVKTHARAAPYILGLITGYLIFQYNDAGNKKISVVKSSLGGMLSLLLLFTAMASGYVFYIPTKEYSAVESAIYAGLYRPVWATGVCLLVVCSVFGRVPVITNMLSWSPWKPLGKLVYGAYLVHLLIQLRALTMSRQPVFLDGFAIVGVCLGDIVYSFSISLLLYLTIEAPTKDMISLLTSQRLRKSKSAQISQTSTGTSNKDLQTVESTDVCGKREDINTITGIFINNNKPNLDDDKNIV